MAHAEKRGKMWRGRYQRPDGTRGSTSGHRTKAAALADAEDEESRIRNYQWIDRRDAEIPFGEFVGEWYEAVKTRLSPTTAAKYRSQLDKPVLPQWQAWPMIGIVNSYIEIEKWVSELHEDYAESSVASVFALFSTIMNAAVRAKVIPATPCSGIRVTSGSYEIERLVATPVQVLRAAMRLYHVGLGASGFMLCVMDAYTGGRWGELAGQQPHEYDEVNRAIGIREPLKEVRGKLMKGGSDVSADVHRKAGRDRRGRRGTGTKTPAGTRWVKLPPSIASLYESLLESTRRPYVFVSPDGRPWHRSNFRVRYWRPAWDGVRPDKPEADDHVPPILPWFTFHEGRHTHATWLAEDGVAEVARRARLGQKMRGMARVYDHVTPAMEQQISDVLEARWTGSLRALSNTEREQLGEWFPQLRATIDRLQRGKSPRRRGRGQKLIPQMNPKTA